MIINMGIIRILVWESIPTILYVAKHMVIVTKTGSSSFKNISNIKMLKLSFKKSSIHSFTQPEAECFAE